MTKNININKEEGRLALYKIMLRHYLISFLFPPVSKWLGTHAGYCMYLHIGPTSGGVRLIQNEGCGVSILKRLKELYSLKPAAPYIQNEEMYMGEPYSWWFIEGAKLPRIILLFRAISIVKKSINKKKHPHQ
jgi:hypothetical protein